MQMRETSTSEGGNYTLPPVLPSEPQFPEKLMGFLTCRKAGTWDIYFTSLPKEGILRIFWMPEKSNGFGRV
jgi:hypothetical protein